MKNALYTFLLWDLFLFAAGLNDLVFYRNVTLSESATVVDWAQPAFASVTLFLILLSIYYGLHQLLFGKNFYLKLEVKQEDIDKMRDFIFILLKKEKIDPDKLHQHLKYLIIAEVVLWCIFIIYLFVSRSTAIQSHYGKVKARQILCLASFHNTLIHSIVAVLFSVTTTVSRWLIQFGYFN